MATKTTKYKTGDGHDIDTGLDIPEFDFGSFEAGFDKKLAKKGPVTEVAGSFASGLGDAVFNRGIIESTIRRALPEEYGAALDLGQKSLGSARSLYNQAVKDFKPAINQFKQVTRTVLPKTEGILSKNIREKLKDWSADQSTPGLSEERMRDQALAIELGQIFEAQAKDADRRAEVDDRKEQIQQGVEQLRHRDKLGLLGDIAENTGRIAAFNDTIATSVMRKSLEVQLRQFYAVSDLLRETKLANMVSRAQREALVRNTGISARSVQSRDDGSFKNKFFDATKRSMFGAARGFADQFIGNVHKDVSEKITSGAQQADMLAGALNMMTSMGDVGGDAMSPKSMVANFLGKWVGDKAIGAVQDKAKEHLGKIPGIQRNAQKIGYNLENLGPQVADYLSNSNNSLGPLEPFRDYLLSMMPKTGVDGKIDVQNLGKSTDQAHFTNATNKSIIEVIPGLLARIQRELVITRTGKDAPLLTYDYSANKFSTEKQIGAKIRESLAGKANQDELKGRFDDLFGKIDPDKELTDDHRERIKTEFLNRGFEGKSTDAKYLANRRTWGEGEDADAISKFFQKHLETNSIGERDEKSVSAITKQRELSKEINRLTRFFSDPRSDIQIMAQLGQLDAIQASGLYNRKTNNLDMRSITEALLGRKGDSSKEFDIEDLLHGERDDDGKLGQVPADFLSSADPTAPKKKIRRDARLVAQEAQRKRELKAAQRWRDSRPKTASNVAPEPDFTPNSTTPITAQLAHPVEAKIDTEALQKLMSDQLEAIKKADPNANLLTIIEVLRSMEKNFVKVEEQLAEGINTYSLTEDMLGEDARGKFRARFKDFKDKAGTYVDADARDRYRSKFEELRDQARARMEDVRAKASEKFDDVKGRFDDLSGKARDKFSKYNPMEKIRGLKNLTLGDLLGSGAAITKKTLAMSTVALGKVPGLIKTGAGIAGDIASQGAKAGNAVLQKGLDAFGDLYVEGEKEPRLLRLKLKKGMYIDKSTGKVLTSFKDIGGAVEENGEVKLEADELEKSYIKGSKTTALKEIATTAMDWGKTVGGLATKALGGFYGTAVKAGIGIVKAGIKMLPPYDVYIKGQEKPVLTAGGFKTSEYFSEKTGNALRHPRDIDGPVLNKTGDHLITEDDIRTGLVDKNGLTVTNKVARLIGKVTQLAKFAIGTGMKALRGLAGGAKEFLVGIGQAMKDIFGGVFGLRGEYLETSKSQLEVQRQILQLLMERLPKNKNVKGDVDGDGLREGSAEDIRRKAADAAEKSGNKEDPGAIKSEKGGGKSLLASIAGMFGGKKKKGDGDEEGEGDTTIVGGLGGAGGKAADAAKGAEKVAKTKNWMGKGGRLARMGGGLWKAAKWTGGAALSLAGLGGLGLGGLASGALSVGGAALGAVGTGLAAAGGVLGAILTAPVILTALGIAAVGAAGYYGYKYLTRKKLETLSKVRFAQYGFSEQDKDRLEVVFGLEDALAKNVKLDGDKPYIDNKVDMDAIMKPFGVKLNGNDAPQWLSWFSKRFKPVFLGHMSVLRGINPEIRLGDVDSKLKPDEKLKYLNASAMPDGPFDVLESPFMDMKQLSVSSSGVKAAVELARSTLEAEAKGDKKAAAAKAVGAAATGAALLKKDGKDGNVQTGNSAPGGQAEAAAKAALADAGAQETSKDGAITISAFNTVPGDFIFTGQKGTVDALSAVRFKAYGLTEMELPKIKSLSQLEIQVAKGLVFTKDGAAYDEDIRDLLARVKILFGIVGPESEEGRAWIIWFRSRFLPVFLNYQTLVAKATGKKEYVRAEMNLTPQQQLDVANAVITTTGVYKGKKVPVWDITESPWRDYNVNTESSSTDLNIQYLTENVKAVKAGEQTKAAKKAEAAANEANAIKDGKAADTKWRVNTPVGQLAIPKDPISLRKDREEMARKTGYIQPGPLNNDGTGVRASGDFVKGAPITHPGKGTGGDINSMPLPTGNNWPGMKAMFEAAAKMTGVDVKTLAAMCAIESNFNPDAKAGTSSASGLFQFLTGTWNGMMNKYGAKYGIDPRTPPTDPRAAVLMGAEFIKENLNTLKNQVKGRELTNTDAYMAHFLGAGTAAKFLNSDPNAIGADVMRGPPGKDPVAANMNVFFDKKTGQPRTLGEIYKLFNMKMDRESKKAGVGDNAPATPNPTPKAGPTPGDSAGGGNVAAPEAKPVAKAPTATAALAEANSSAAPVSAVVTKTTAPIAQPQPTAEAPAGGGAYTAPSMPAQPVVKPPVRPVADFNGWDTRSRPSGAEITAQSDAVRKAMLQGMTDIGAVLTESRDIQTKILAGIDTIAKNTAAPKGAAVPVETAVKPAANAPAAPISQRAPAAPVSMKRGY